jgi:hypothetical protein
MTNKDTPEYRKEYQRKYYLTHKDKSREYQREYNARKREEKRRKRKLEPRIKFEGPEPILPQNLAHLTAEQILRVFNKVKSGKAVFVYE